MPLSSGERRGYSALYSSFFMLLVLLFGLPAIAQQPKVLAPHRPLAPRLEKRLPVSKPMVRQSATGGLWMTDADWKAALYLKSGLKTDPVTVTPVLYLSNGQCYPLSPVTLEPSGTAIVDIGQALESVGIAPYATLCGYAEIDYQWPWTAVTATVKNVDVVHSLIYIFGLQPSPDWHPEHMESMPVTLPTSFEGLWWKQEGNVSGFLALSNVTAQPIDATIRLTDQSDAQLASYQVTVSPHGTKMVALNELETAAGGTGGVYLTHDGPERGLDINGGLEDKAVGYSAHLWMWPQLQPPSASQPQSPQAASFSELGLMTGAADPMMNFPSGTVFTPYSLVRNISNQPAAVTPELWWMSGGSPQSATLPQMTISPHQTVNLNVPALLAAAGLKHFNGNVNLILDTTVQAGGLVLSSGSVDQTNTYVFEVMPHGVEEGASKQLCYWSTGNGDDTMVTLWNPADEAQDFALTLFYTGGQYVYPIHLGPRETRTFNVSAILESSMPDAAGNVIPAGIEEGSAEIAGSLGEQQQILIGLDAAVYNIRKATCGTVCWYCGGVVYAALDLDPFGLEFDGTTQETFYETWSTGSQSSPAARWSSSAPYIATVNNSGLVSGVNTGSFTLSAWDDYYETEYNSDYCSSLNYYCPTFIPETSGGGTSLSVTFSPISSVAVGQTATTIATVSPSNNSVPISLSISSPAEIVSPTGTFTTSTAVVVKGLTVGTATLTATVQVSDGGTATVGTTSFPVVMPSISQSNNLWFFGTGVGTPSGFTLGSTSATLTLNGAGNGTYAWTITNGSSELAFQNGSSSITLTNTNTVTVSSKSGSKSSNDVSVQLQYTPAGGSAITLPVWNITIDWPYKLLLGSPPQPVAVSSCVVPPVSGTAGWQQLIPYYLQSKFGVFLANFPVNESFGQRVDAYQGNNWPTSSPNGLNTLSGVNAGAFSDDLCVINATTPPSLPPQSPLGNVLVYQLAQTWSAGSLTIGGGQAVQNDTINLYEDHGTVTQITSPVQ